MNILIFLCGLFALMFAIARSFASFQAAALATGSFLVIFTLFGGFSLFWGLVLWSLYLCLSVFFGTRNLRLTYLTKPLLKRIKAILPPMSQTECDAIEAGSVWWESELFCGSPDWQKLHSYPTVQLSDEEQAFIDGPVNQLCAMIDDWDITHKRLDLPQEMWTFLKQHGFFGMIIPKKYGGLELSAYGHSAVVMKLSGRSTSVGVTVMVPNSLGPAELLLHYGTEEQKDYYLPRLASGVDMPCSALTGPDAGSIPDTGIVCEGEFEGKQVLGLKLNWEKRYITLGPVATVLGLAFKVYDPDGLLGGEVELGITCALIPTNSAGITIGNRHFPMNAAFMNGPNSGKDVFIPMDYLIGGVDNIGKGWRMLVESLSAGGGISLPAVGVAAGKTAARFTGAYAHIRKQFNTSIGKFEGVEEALARIGGMSYMMEAGRLLTLSALDNGVKPSVITAILKHYNAEMMRQVLNDAMDVHGGRGICMGPGNYLAHSYQSIPVGITVEGTNILTRTMIIFGQGAIRCHPYLVAEMKAVTLDDEDAGVQAFDTALTGHAAYFVTNLCRAFVYAITASHLAQSPVSGRMGAYYKRLSQMSAAFAVTSDLALMILGGSFKHKEKLSGRFADALGYLYYASAVLKKFEADGAQKADIPLVEWSAKHCLYQIQIALDDVLRNFPIKSLGILVRMIIFPLGLSLRQPNDALGHRVASLLIRPGEARDRLTHGIYISQDENDITGCLEDALAKVLLAAPIERRLKAAHQVKPDLQSYPQWVDDMVKVDVISHAESEILLSAQTATRNVIMVDDFTTEELLSRE